MTRENINQAVTQAAINHQVPIRVMHTVMQVESSGNPYARSPKGTLGPMQMMPSTARQYGARDVYNPYETVGPAATDQIYLTLWGTGFLKAKVVSATVGGLDVGVLYWGLQSSSAAVMGLDQINIGPLPRTLIGHGRVNIIVTADGQTANPVQVVVK